MYIKDEKISKLIEGKRIVLVGPSSHLFGKGMGDIIDDYDIVCRSNDFFPFNHERDFGSRTDIASVNFAFVSMVEYQYKYQLEPERTKNIKLVMCPVVKSLGPDPWMSWKNDHVSEVVNSFNNMNTFNIPFSWVGVENYRYLYNLIGVEANSGMMTLMILLQYDIREIFLTGFSFYHNGVSLEDCYYKNYILKDLYTKEKYPYGNFNPGISHNQGAQVKFLINNLLPLHKEKIKLDSYLNELYNINHTNVEYIW
jgi:hypothetical protein